MKKSKKRLKSTKQRQGQQCLRFQKTCLTKKQSLPRMCCLCANSILLLKIMISNSYSLDLESLRVVKSLETGKLVIHSSMHSLSLRLRISVQKLIQGWRVYQQMREEFTLIFHNQQQRNGMLTVEKTFKKQLSRYLIASKN